MKERRIGRLTERFFGRVRRPDPNKRVRIRRLRDVARRPSVKTGVWIFCSRGSLTPVAAPNVFFGMRITGSLLADEDVSAPGANVETGASVPSYSGGLAACAVVLDLDLL